jgi:hypothetical protein
MRAMRFMLVIGAVPGVLCAQAPKQAGAGAAADVPPPAQQISAAVLALPNEYREGAKVLGYRAGTKGFVTLREGTGPFTCLANDPAGKMFHVACYHQTLEPFMARGRELRASGTPDNRVDTVRFAEVKSGKLQMPKQPASMYQLFGGTVDPATGAVKDAKPLFVIYISGATGATTGLSEKPTEGAPWIMFPGTPKAHIMLTPKM